ncbi:MAG: response regulator transcription factor [Chitinophagaceae bacterium]
MKQSIKIALVDDHALLRKGLAELIKNIGYPVVIEADNGKDFMAKMKTSYQPDVVLLDINMPQMDGYETALWLKQQHPEVKVLALSMYDDENAIIRMLKNGAKGYILKDTDISLLKDAIENVYAKGFHYSEMVTGRLIHSLNNMDNNHNGTAQLLKLNDREVEFLKLACSEMTYREIAEKMFLSPRTIDGYRDALFEKLAIKTRVGLAIYAIKHGVVHV